MSELNNKVQCIYGNEDCKICPHYSSAVPFYRDPYLKDVHDAHLLGQFLTSFFEKVVEIVTFLENWWKEREYGSKAK